MMQNMAAMGRYGDTQMAHVAPGEMVVPGPVLNANPGLRAGIMTAIGQQGVDPTRYMVGSPTGSYNPMTGRQEFFLPALFSAIGSLAASPFGQAALTTGLTSLLTGSKPKDALRNALIGCGLARAEVDELFVLVRGIGYRLALNREEIEIVG